jgi:hypothetical protein
VLIILGEFDKVLVIKSNLHTPEQTGKTLQYLSGTASL